MNSSPLNTPFYERVRRVVLSLNAKVICSGILLGAAYVAIDAGILPHIKDGTSPLQSLGFIILPCLLFFISILIGSIVLLFNRKWIAALCFVLGGLLATPASHYLSAALNDDRFVFTAGPHGEIASIYDRRRSEIERNKATARLVDLGVECHPPPHCGCWIVLDLANTSGTDKEIGGWHRPAYTSIFPIGMPPEQFAIVNVRRLNAHAYSVLGCPFDPTALFDP